MVQHRGLRMTGDAWYRQFTPDRVSTAECKRSRGTLSIKYFAWPHQKPGPIMPLPPPAIIVAVDVKASNSPMPTADANFELTLWSNEQYFIEFAGCVREAHPITPRLATRSLPSLTFLPRLPAQEATASESVTSSPGCLRAVFAQARC